MSGLFSFSRCRPRRTAAAGLCRLLVVSLLLAGCETYTAARDSASGSLGSGRTFAIYGLEGRWAGDVTPTATDCGSQTRGSMLISSHGFAFDPFDSTFVITGAVSDRGALRGTLTRVLSGNTSKHVERSLTFTGNSQQPDGGEARIVGQLESGRCTWRVSLQRG